MEGQGRTEEALAWVVQGQEEVKDAVGAVHDDVKDEEMAMETDTDARPTLGARRQRVRLRAIVPEFSPHARFPASTRR